MLAKFSNLKIRNKLALVMASFALILVSTLYGFYYFQAKEELESRTFLHLSSVKELKQFQITKKLQELQKAFELDKLPHYLLEDKWLFFQGEITSQDTVIGPYVINVSSFVNKGFYMFDISQYDTNGNITLAFIKQNKKSYKLVILRPNIQNILLERTGLGVSGESYLVGEDMKMVSKSRFFPDKRPMDITVNTTGTQKAFKETTGHGIFKDYRNQNVFSVYGLINVSGIKWALLTEMDEQEALEALNHLNRNFLIILVFTFLLIFFVSYRLSTQLTKPLLQVSYYLKKMSKGIYQPNMKLESRKDEIGDLYTSLKQLVNATEHAIDFSRDIGNGNFNKEFYPLSSEDRLGLSLLQMKERLIEYRTKQNELEQQNRVSFITGEENERKRLSKEIHDGIGPLITLLQLKIETIEIKDHIRKELLTLISDVLGELRTVSYNLMPSVLIDFGAGEAIRNLLSLIKSDKLDISYVYDHDDTVNIPMDVSILLYRVVQEAMNNVLRHSDATRVHLSLTEFSDKVSLYIKDNGKGFDVNNAKYGNGIINMRERVNLKKGTFEISTSPGGGGTEIEVEIPLL